MKTYKGSCHCGTVQYEVQTDLKMVFDCNCSMCSKKGTILTIVPPEQFKMISGENTLSDYQFYKKNIHHTFCKNCGVTSFATGKDQTGNTMKAINVRCLDGVDLNSLELMHVDGKSF
jgi:hypothetical protein